MSALFDQLDDPYLRERKGDVDDVVGRLCVNLRTGGDPLDLFRDVEGPLVLVAEELSPSLIAQLDFQRLAAFVTDAGSWTYHTAILARSIHVPPSPACATRAAVIPPGALVAVDGASGDVLVDPDRRGARRPRGAVAKRRAYEQSLDEYATCRRSRTTARRSASRRTSNCPRKPRARGSAAPRGSASTDRSSCWPARARPGSTKTRSTRSIAA